MINNWSEMPLGVLIQMADIDKLPVSDEEKTFMATSLLAGMDYKKFMDLPIPEARELVQKTEWVRTPPQKRKVQKEYKIGTRDYVLHKDMMGITTAQYIDYQGLITQGIDTNMAELMAICLIPKGFKYNDGYSKEEIVDEIRDCMSVEDALAVADFFTTKFAKLTKRTTMKLEAQLTAQRILARGEAKEKLKAMEIQMKLVGQEVRRYMCGYHWWKQWPN